MYCWMNGRVIPTNQALVSPMESIHLGIFEGIKAYVEGDILGEGDLNIFGWEGHIDRLWRSAEVNGIVMPYSKVELLEAVRACIVRNDYDKNTYIQPRIWPKGSWGSDDSHVVVPVWPFETLLGKKNSKFDVERRFMVSSWRRISSDALPPQAKSWANYLNSMHAVREAKRCGYDNAVFLDNRGFISEATLACLMMVRDGKVITSPVTARTTSRPEWRHSTTSLCSRYRRISSRQPMRARQRCGTPSTWGTWDSTIRPGSARRPSPGTAAPSSPTR